MTPRRISRRTFLRGVGGVTVALPALEIATARKAQASPPRRFVLMYGGSSLGGDGVPAGSNLVVPKTAGAGWELTRGLQPLAEVKADVAVVSGLKIPWASGGAVPPGGCAVNFHGYTLVPQVTGTRQPAGRDSTASTASADQSVADAIGAGAPHRSLVFRVQPVSYAGGSGGNRGRLSWGPGGRVIDPIVSPRLAYPSPFSGLPAATGTATPVKNPALDVALQRRRSVLDLVRGETERLLPRLGRADRERMQRHFDELRDLEKRLAGSTAAPAAGRPAACVRPAAPGEDPPIGSNHRVDNNQLHFTSGAGYSNEELRAQLIIDFVALALACDQARSASIMFTMTQCFMSMEPIGGQKSDLHELGHGRGTNRDVADGVAWHVKQLARLVGRLREVRESDGRTVLDHSALVPVFEGGHGHDPGGGRAVSSHSSENMIALVAGRAGGLRVGQHLVAADRHPVQAILAAMRAVGAPGALGEVAAPLPDLLPG